MQIILFVKIICNLEEEAENLSKLKDMTISSVSERIIR